MKLSKLFVALGALAALGFNAQAAISVGPGGSGTITFDTLPAAGDWSTIVNTGTSADIADATALDAAVQTNVASAINMQLGSTATTAPAISANAIARWNSSLFAVQTVPTTVGYVSLMATLRNDTGVNQSALTLAYDLTENHATGGTNANAVVEEISGHRVYFSLTGAADSWQVIPEISSIGSTRTLVGTANLGSWGNGNLLYVLWADDNAVADRNNTNNEEGGYLIDNITFKAGTMTGAISVGLAGSGTITFSTYPNVLEGWYTVTNTGGSPDIADTTALDNAVQTNVAAGVTKQLGNSATVTPSISSSSIARWNYTLQAIQTVPTGIGYVTVMAKLRNDSGSAQSTLSIAYDFNELNVDGTTVVEEIPGHRVYYSLTGDSGSWQVIPELSGGTPGTLIATLNLGSWPAGGLLYVLWADDNAAAGRATAGPGDTEGGYTIDNVSFSFGTISGVSISTPTNGQTFPLGIPITVNAVAVLPGTVTDVSFFNGGNLIGSDSTAPFSAVFSNATLGAHSLTATATDSLGNMASSSPVSITVVPNNPPTVNFTTPVNGATFFVGSNIPHQVTTSDSDGNVVRVEFYVDGSPFFTDNTSPYSFELCDITAGAHSISAVAVDNGGARGTNTISISATNPPGISVIIPNGSTWKYLDDGSDQGVFWTALGFDDSTWSSGVAELGYGDAAGNNRPERTVLSFGADPNAKRPTTYFRKSITVPNPNAFTGLDLRVLRDDGAIVYINGTAVFRTGISNDAVVDFSTYTPPAVADDGTVYQTTNISTSVLVAGQNDIAVEIHQDAPNSSDISFDLMLWGTVPAGPTMTITQEGSNVRIRWTPSTGTLQYTDNMNNAPVWTDQTTGQVGPGEYLVPADQAHRFYSLRQ